MKELKVGDYLYDPYTDNNERFLKIEKIGKKWIGFSNGRRCSIDKLMLDRGAYSARQLYTSKEKYYELCVLNDSWRNLRQYFYNHLCCPTSVTIERIKEARKILGIDDK